MAENSKQIKKRRRHLAHSGYESEDDSSIEDEIHNGNSCRNGFHQPSGSSQSPITISSDPSSEDEESSYKRKDAKGRWIIFDRSSCPSTSSEHRRHLSQNYNYMVNSNLLTTMPSTSVSTGEENPSNFVASIAQPLPASPGPADTPAFYTDSSSKRLEIIAEDNFINRRVNDEDRLQSLKTFDDMPPEIKLKIFSYLKNNDLINIQRVDSSWRQLARSRSLWKNVDIKLQPYNGSQTVMVNNLLDNLPNEVDVTYIRLDFACTENWTRGLDIEEVAIKISSKCENLETLILLHTELLANAGVVDACVHNIRKLKELQICFSHIPIVSEETEFFELPQLELLNLFGCIIDRLEPPFLPNLPNLKILSLGNTAIQKYFGNTTSFYENLRVFDISYTDIDFRSDVWIFRELSNHATNLTELYLCSATLSLPMNLTIPQSAFPNLKLICFRYCQTSITPEFVVSLINKLNRLEDLYVERERFETMQQYAKGKLSYSDLAIIKTIDACFDHRNRSKTPSHLIM